MAKSSTYLTLVTSVLPFVVACSGTDTGNDAAGGTTDVGGAANVSGARNSGGATSSGGAARGGTTASGATNSGGAARGGAATNTGGAATNASGASNGGGTSVTVGGSSASGATTSTGGSGTAGAPRGGTAGTTNRGGAASGGASSAGKGGLAATGGASTGGNATTGGSAGAAGNPTGRVATCPVPAGAEMPEASLPAGYCSWVFAEGLTSPRGIVTDALGQLVVIEGSAVTLLWDSNGDRVNQSSERLRIATVSGLNHGVAINGGYLYASTATTVYRWPYDGSRAALSNRQTVLSGMPSGGHSTRTIVFDGSGNMYVSIGSNSNVDANSNRARVIRLAASQVATGTATLADTTVYADGTRNEVGLRFDGRGRLWGVENGVDNLSRSDLGGDIHNDNPAEELNLFDDPGAFYGYPYCWSEGALPTSVGLGAGTQWAMPGTMNDGTHTDAWCRNVANVKKPVLTMQAHSAPLDILFYTGGSFPDNMIGSALITFHGSWNRSTATGYKVVVVPFGSDGMPSGSATPLLESAAGGDTGGGWSHRPVSLSMGKSGEVYVTSDANGLVLAIGHQ